MATIKREINDELCDVWAMMMYERLDEAMEKKEKAEHIEESTRLDGYINGISMSLAIFAALEKGKLIKDYERLLKIE